MYRTPDMLIEYFKDKKVLILGFGREGKSTYHFIRKYLPEQPLGIADKNPVTVDDAHVTLHCGADYLIAMADYDIIMKSPGIPFVGVKIPQGCAVTCQTDLYLKYADATVIGITGTKGKTTTSTLIYRMLKAAGLHAGLKGNIGVPVFDSIEDAADEVTVMELSCHQLEFMTASPHIAVITNIYEEHLDHYNDGFIGYVAAKMNITNYQSSNDYFIFNPQSTAKDYMDPAALPARVIEADPAALAPAIAAAAEKNPHLKGAHNRQNIQVAAQAVRRLGVTDAAIINAIDAYEGISDRMELFGVFGGVEYYNDSIATIPYSVLMGVDALGNVGSLIIGGMDRGLDYTDFAKQLCKRPIDNIICLPETGHNIAKLLQADGCMANIVIAADMETAVKAAVKYTAPGKACVLSPAAASYNYYKNFEEKGKHYKTLVKKLTNNESE
ncbi:MAG: UDP-N-acetylmuramoyl-L-alanine--D-glutamate ligase [Clostridia bacterium]|nr:UDP-N-acetylmuramoyl-L-alanine--D-glutamate ligase [Clostridia bacterium]